MGGLEKETLILTRTFTIRASHFLTASEKYKEDLGEICDVLHGHEYHIEVSLINYIDEITGLSLSRNYLDEIKDKVISKYHNSTLNEHFKYTSGESLCKDIYLAIKALIPNEWIYEIAIQETSKNRFLYQQNCS